MMTNDELYMAEALKEAEKALLEGEVPVGAVIVKDDKIVGRGRNSAEREKNAVRHAEINAISDACKNLKSRTLQDCTMYVTLEPCPMCAGAILQTRIKKVLYALPDRDGGAFGGVIDLSKVQPLKGPLVKKGVLEDESRHILEEFFRKIRDKNPNFA